MQPPLNADRPINPDPRTVSGARSSLAAAAEEALGQLDPEPQPKRPTKRETRRYGKSTIRDRSQSGLEDMTAIARSAPSFESSGGSGVRRQTLSPRQDFAALRRKKATQTRRGLFGSSARGHWCCLVDESDLLIQPSRH